MGSPAGCVPAQWESPHKITHCIVVDFIALSARESRRSGTVKTRHYKCSHPHRHYEHIYMYVLIDLLCEALHKLIREASELIPPRDRGQSRIAGFAAPRGQPNDIDGTIGIIERVKERERDRIKENHLSASVDVLCTFWIHTIVFGPKHDSRVWAPQTFFFCCILDTATCGARVSSVHHRPNRPCRLVNLWP